MIEIEQKILELFLSCEIENINLGYTLLDSQGIGTEAFVEKHFGNLLRFTGISKSNVLYPPDITFWTPLHDMLTRSEIRNNSGDGENIPDNLHWLQNLRSLSISDSLATVLPESLGLKDYYDKWEQVEF